jgi:hypothetical protein
MKNLVKNLLISSALFPLFAFANNGMKPGWEFTLNLSGGYVSSQSQFSTSDENLITDSLYSSGEKTTTALVYPLARIQYTFPRGQNQIYIGNSSDQVSTAQFQYELGYVHQFKSLGKLTVAYFPELPFLNDTWSDPFLVGEERDVTEENAQGGRLSWERFLGLPFVLKYAAATSEVDNEMSGVGLGTLSSTELEMLGRDSVYNRIQIETFFPIMKGLFLRPSLQYTYRDATGDAISNDGYTAQLGLLHFRDRHTFISTFDYTSQESEAINPIFDKVQTTDKWGVFLIYDYARPFSLPNTSFNLLAGYSSADSNIDFYDTNTLITSLGVTLRF